MTDDVKARLVSIRDQLEAYRDQLDALLAFAEADDVGEDDVVMRYHKDPPKPPKGNFQGWVWPMPIWQGKTPAISDGFQRFKTDDHRQHLGVDLMYKNARACEPQIPEQTKWYHCPSGTIPMLAMGGGNIWYAGLLATGWSVLVDHHDWVGFPLVTYYTHMSELFVDPWHKGEQHEGDGKPGGQYVYPGFELGLVGNSPKGADPNHAHVELRDFSDGIPEGRVNRCLDPEMFLPSFSRRVIGRP